MSRDQLKLCMWTGIAVRPYKGAVEVSMKVKRRNNEVPPCRSSQIYGLIWMQSLM